MDHNIDGRIPKSHKHNLTKDKLTVPTEASTRRSDLVPSLNIKLLLSCVVKCSKFGCTEEMLSNTILCESRRIPPNLQRKLKLRPCPGSPLVVRHWEAKVTLTLYTSPYVPLPTLWMSSKSCWGFLLWISALGRGKMSMVAPFGPYFTSSGFDWLWRRLVEANVPGGFRLITGTHALLLRAPCPGGDVRKNENVEKFTLNIWITFGIRRLWHAIEESLTLVNKRDRRGQNTRSELKL